MISMNKLMFKYYEGGDEPETDAKMLLILKNSKTAMGNEFLFPEAD